MVEVGLGLITMPPSPPPVAYDEDGISWDANMIPLTLFLPPEGATLGLLDMRWS